MLIKKLSRAIFALALFLFSISLSALSYDNLIIHPKLTRASAELYNSQARIKLTQEQVNWIVEGSIAEDTDPRYLNHFYNPKTKTGLDDWAYIRDESMYFTGVAAKDWAKRQKSATGDYSWGATLENYRKGYYKRAYQGIGHILHLIQDMAQPAHTRNDAHPPFKKEKDPYEEWAQDYGHVNLSQAKLIKINNLDQAFDELANYSHDNFFSKDTITTSNLEKYKQEVKIIDEVEKIYFINLLEGKDYKLFFSKNSNSVFPIYEINDFKVLLDYWNMLSPKAAGYGAGVIDLFIQEFAKIDQAEKKEKLSLKEKTRHYLIDIKNKAKYKWGDDFLAARIKGTEAWDKTKKLYSKTTQNLSFFDQANQELIAYATEEGLNYIKQLESSNKNLIANNNARLNLQKEKTAIKQTISLEEKEAAKTIKNPVKKISAQKTQKPINAIKENSLKLSAPQSVIKKAEAQVSKRVSKQDNIKSSQESKKETPDDYPKIEVVSKELDQDLLKATEEINPQNVNNSLIPVLQFQGFSPGFVVIAGDSTAPETSIVSQPAEISSSTIANFIFSSNDGDVKFSYNYDYNGWFELDGDQLNIINIEDGGHSIEVRASDQANNADLTPAIYSWEVDTQAPAISIVSAPAAFSNLESVDFNFEADEIVSWECQLDNEPAQICNATTTVSSLREGEHDFLVKAQDNVNNIATTAYSWLVDLTAPTSTISSFEPYYLETGFNLAWSGNDNASTSSSALAGFDIEYNINNQESVHYLCKTAPKKTPKNVDKTL